MSKTLSSLGSTATSATSSRLVGLILVLVGLVVIIVAITLAYNAFYNYQLPEITGSTIEEIIASLMRALVEVAVRLGFLGIIVWAASILLKHGITLMK
jgi:hypothetical protein